MFWVIIRLVFGSVVFIVVLNMFLVYILLRVYSLYVIVYEEGYSSCMLIEIDNFYSFCNNLFKICVKFCR